MDALRSAVFATFAYPLEIHLVLPLDPESEARLHWLHEHTDVISVVHGPSRIEVVVRCRLQDREVVEGLGAVALERDLSASP